MLIGPAQFFNGCDRLGRSQHNRLLVADAVSSRKRPGIALEVRDLGLTAYAEALELQKAAAAKCLEGGVGTLFLLEHAHVVTLGRNSDEGNLLVARGELARRGVEIHDCDRGGDVTYHGPGQLVGYPCMLLPEGRRGVKEYVSDIEEALLRTLAEFGINKKASMVGNVGGRKE